ncbi:hypothetical protein SGLAM104S_01031 [Streptomyces glaucescens]
MGSRSSLARTREYTGSARSSDRPRAAEGRGVRGVGVEGGEGLVAPGADGAGGEGVAGDVDGVDGLAGAGVAGVEPLQFGVDRREGSVDLLADGAREARRHLLLLALTHSHTLLISVLRNQ